MNAWAAERAMEREQDALDRDYAEGRITRAEHNAASRELERDLRAAYEEDCENALREVDEEWGRW